MDFFGIELAMSLPYIGGGGGEGGGGLGGGTCI